MQSCISDSVNRGRVDSPATPSITSNCKRASSYTKHLLLYVRWRTVAAPDIARRGQSIVCL
jgi:hypothetical protein